EDGRATVPLPVDQLNDNDTRDAIFTDLSLAGRPVAGGFRLTSLPPSLANSGLRIGDVILRLDDDAFTDSERRADLARSMATGRRADLLVRRDGRDIDVVIGG
ncbi:MAG: PDZ domain-containing protein, partial [Pacificimonas sp.]